MDFLPKTIEQYAERFTSEEPALLKSLSRETHTRVLMPRMISGHIQGRLLSILSRMIRPARILEIGTYTGYSAICLAEGLDEKGMLDTLEVNEELEPMLRRYFRDSGMERKICLHIGDASVIIPSLKGPYDMVYIDADKENYCKYYDLVFPSVRKGGWILADNLLWSGKVTDDNKKPDEETEALREYARKIHSDSRVDCLLLPVRDGIMICQKH